MKKMHGDPATKPSTAHPSALASATKAGINMHHKLHPGGNVGSGHMREHHKMMKLKAKKDWEPADAKK